jgi:hypothetical protein
VLACSKCHTVTPGHAHPSIADEGWTEAQLQKQIRRGGGGYRNRYLMMPAIDQAALPESSLPLLYAFLRTKGTLR